DAGRRSAQRYGAPQDHLDRGCRRRERMRRRRRASPRSLADGAILSDTMSLQAKAARIKLMLFDVDGVLTDGKLLVHPDGSDSKQFDIKDGLAIVWAQRAGLTVGFLSARSSPATLHRAAQLGVTLVHQGVSSKLE